MTRLATTTVAAAVMLLAVASAPACGGDSVGNQGLTVGGSCANDRDCDQKCLTGGDFPQGTCSVRCSNDAQCPGGTACVDKDGGYCLLTCDFSSDCRGGYTCKGKKRVDKSGEVLVCIE
ncbi:MAG: hypothetical protein KC503_28060 [Myxococcales bacterium]|nr:hypothetical protein [Myxococcales bacterium]